MEDCEFPVLHEDFLPLGEVHDSQINQEDGDLDKRSTQSWNDRKIFNGTFNHFHICQNFINLHLSYPKGMLISRRWYKRKDQ